MKKICLILMVLFMAAFVLPSFAEETAVYTWRDYSIEVTSFEESQMFAPAGIQADEYSVSVTIKTEGELAENEDLSGELYDEIRLADADGQMYEPGAMMTWTVNDAETYKEIMFAVPKTVAIENLSIQFGDTAAIPEEFVGVWKGEGDYSIVLTATILADGTGSYIFEQNDYREEGEFNLSVTDNTFSLYNPTTSILNGVDGTYELADGVLTLNISSLLESGRIYSYSVVCTRIGDAPAE